MKRLLVNREQVQDQAKKATRYFARILEENDAHIFAVEFEGAMLIVARDKQVEKIREAFIREGILEGVEQVEEEST